MKLKSAVCGVIALVSPVLAGACLAGDAPIARNSDFGPSSGCGQPVEGGGQFEQSTVDGRGTARFYKVQVPTDYDPAKPLALTIVFHGGGSDENGAMGFGLQSVAGANAASVFVFPRGMRFEDHGIGWNDSCDGYDMAFFDNIVSSIEAKYCIDTNRVFVAGFSWGCDFVTALACCRGDRLKAIAAASCSDEFARSDDYRTYANATCPVANRAAIRFSHAIRGDDLYPPPLFQTTANLFRSLNLCSKDSPSTVAGSCQSYAGCTRPVIDCAIPRIGHAPGPHWAEDTWRFFMSDLQ